MGRDGGNFFLGAGLAACCAALCAAEERRRGRLEGFFAGRESTKRVQVVPVTTVPVQLVSSAQQVQVVPVNAAAATGQGEEKVGIDFDVYAGAVGTLPALNMLR